MKFFISYKNYTFLILLLHIIVFCDLFCQTNKKFDATFKIWTEKDHYFTYEPIWVNYRIVNRGETGPSIGQGRYYWIFNITDSKGVKYRPIIHNSNVSQQMKPGQVHCNEIDISGSYSHPDSIMKCKIFAYDFMPGQYKIQGYWRQNGYDTLFSNSIKVTVAEPEGDEKKAMKLFKKGYYLFHCGKRELQEEVLLELVHKYQKSYYTVHALYLISLIHNRDTDIKGMDKMLFSMKKIIEEYPNSQKFYRHVALSEIKDYYRKKGDIHGAKEYMLKLQQIVKDREIKDRIEKTIQEIDQGKFIIE